MPKIEKIESKWRNLSIYSSVKIRLDQIEKKEISQIEINKFLCKFPAHYLVGKEIIDKNYLFDLSQCEGFNLFRKELDYNKLSIAFASELQFSTSSSFGHTFLVFHDHEFPELDAVSVNFAALTNKEDALINYILNGLTGEYFGQFRVEPFFYKVNEYIKLQQRSLSFFEIKFDQKQKEFFIALLYELKNQRIRYYFLNNNCSNQIDYLLKLTLDKEFSKKWFSIPINVIEDNKNVLNKEVAMLSYGQIARQESSKLSDNDMKELEEVIYGSSELNERSTKSLRQNVFYHFEYNFRHKNTVYPKYKKNILKSKIRKYKNEQSKFKALERNKLSKVSIKKNLKNGNEHTLSYSPLYYDWFSPLVGRDSEKQFSLFDFKFSNEKNQFVLNELTIFEMNSFSPYQKFISSINASLYLGLNDFNFQHKKKLELSPGIGQTFNSFVTLQYLVSLSLFYSSTGMSLRVKPNLKIFKNIFDKHKIGIEHSALYQDKNKINKEYLFYTYRIYQNHEIIFNLDNNTFTDSSYGVEYKYYF